MMMTVLVSKPKTEERTSAAARPSHFSVSGLTGSPDFMLILRLENAEGAATAYAKDALYRRWNTQHGGVYAPVTAATPPNPYLVDVPEREIRTPSGRLLTLLNHAYMIRQVYEMDGNGPEGHLVASRPLNPKNLPDAWENRALASFAAGKNESFAVMDTKERREFRLMRPLKLLRGCVPCHEAQGFKEGDIYGAMSIAVDMAPMKQTRGLVC